MKLIELFISTGKPFSYYPGFINRFGISVNACVFLCYVGWKTMEDDVTAWVELTTSQITDATGLSVKEQSNARSTLIDAGLIEEEYKRLEHQLRFRLKNKDIEPASSENGHSPKRQMGKLPLGEWNCIVQEKKGEKEASPPRPSKGKATLDEIKAFCRHLNIPESDGEYLFHSWEGSGWTRAGKPIKNWESCVRAWLAGGYLPSQKMAAKKQRPSLI